MCVCCILYVCGRERSDLMILQRSEVKIFNDFLGEVKGQLIGTRYSSFWECIVTGGTAVMVTASPDLCLPLQMVLPW